MVRIIVRSALLWDSTLRDNPAERKSHIHGGASLKSCTCMTLPHHFRRCSVSAPDTQLYNNKLLVQEKSPGMCCPLPLYHAQYSQHMNDTVMAQQTTWNANGIAVLHESRHTNSTKTNQRVLQVSVIMCGSLVPVRQFAPTYVLTLGLSRRRKSNSPQEAAGLNFFVFTAAIVSFKTDDESVRSHHLWTRSLAGSAWNNAFFDLKAK